MTDLRPIVVIAAASSGSTALTGFLHRCGAYTCPPHQSTNDERTPSAYEPYRYAAALRTLFDERTLKQTGEIEHFRNFFEIFWEEEVGKARAQGFETIVLKHPLHTLILPYLHRRIDPKFILVTRPLREIENTRLRRQWHPVHGEWGAKQIYSVAMNFLIEYSCPCLSVPYNAMLHSREMRDTLVRYCGLSPGSDRMKKAEGFLSIR